MKPVLLVEDDRAILEGLQMVLELNGFTVKSAQNGLEALTQLRSADPMPGVVLLDLMMPVMDGVGFLIEKKKDSRLTELPIVVMSARNNMTEMVSKDDVVDFIKKPIDIEMMLEAVKRYCA